MTGAGTAVVVSAGMVEVSTTGANVLGVVAWSVTAGGRDAVSACDQGEDRENCNGRDKATKDHIASLVMTK